MILGLVLLFVFLSPLAENPKVMQVRRDDWRPPNPTCCSKLQHVLQSLFQLSFDHRQGWRVHSLSRSLLQCLATPMVDSFAYIKLKLPMFSLFCAHYLSTLTTHL